jgi:hypothetical protein
LIEALQIFSSKLFVLSKISSELIADVEAYFWTSI